MTQWPMREAVVFRPLGIAFVAMIVATACGAGTTVTSSPSTTPASPTANPTPAEQPIDALFDIGNGRKLHLECIGAGSPVIVIDVGGDDTIHGSWDAVYQPLSEVSRVCGYDRANLGQSDPAPGPRTVEDLADDLAELLQVAQVPDPFVFVGGSMGGNIVSVLAAKHPEEVAGIVFVDSDPANDDPSLDPLRHNLDPDVYAACCDPSLYLPAPDDPANTEHIDYFAGYAAELTSVHDLPRVPTIVLTSTQYECQPEWPCDDITADHARLQAEWIKGNPHGEQRRVDSGHVMQREAPEDIIAAATELVETLRP